MKLLRIVGALSIVLMLSTPAMAQAQTVTEKLVASQTNQSVIKSLQAQAKKLGIDTTGLTADQLRAKIKAASDAAVQTKVLASLQAQANKLGIDTKEVLDAAGTKWNFHHYTPGLVGGHCIGVDPYYLAFEATKHGYHPKIILSSREINDYMARHLAEITIKELNNAGKILKHAKVVLLGLTFKENVTDIRNTRAADVVKYLQEFGVEVIGCEPNVDAETIRRKMSIQNVSQNALPECDAVILINKHEQFSNLTLDILKQKMNKPILVDVKRMFSKEEAVARGFVYKSL